jgi:thioester reductase-like protein
MRWGRVAEGSRAMKNGSQQTFLDTGATGFLGRRLVIKLLENDASAHVVAMARPNDPQRTDAEKYLGRHAEASLHRVEWIVGDITRDMLGLDDAALGSLADLHELNVLHLAALYDLEATQQRSKALNLDGAIRAYELALAVRRRREGADRPVRFCQTSTLAVAGTYDGEFGESGEELAQAAGMHTDWYSQHKYEAELALRERAATGEVPLMIVRPGIAVGESQTGAIEKLDGPYCLMEYLRWPILRHFVPTAGPEPFWMVPGDFVVGAIAALAARPQAYGHTFNLLYPPSQTPTWDEVVRHTLQILRDPAYAGGGLSATTARLRYGWHVPLPIRWLVRLTRRPWLGPPIQRFFSALGVEPHRLFYTVDNARYTVDNYPAFNIDPPPPWPDVWRACVLYYRDHRDEMKSGAGVAHQKER